MDVLSFFTSFGWIPAVFLLVGIASLIFEIFHPGFGAPGIIGLIMVAIGVILKAKTLLEAFILILLIIFILGIALTLALHSATKGRLSKTLVLSDSLKSEDGYIGTEDLEYFLDKEGLTVTILRPSGTANFDGVKLDVVSEGEFIDKDQQVKIVKVEGRRIVVKQI